jgi:hypothetical protein
MRKFFKRCPVELWVIPYGFFLVSLGFYPLVALAQQPAQPQPIAAEKITPFYVEFLEIQLAQERLTTAQKDLDVKKAALNTQFQTLLDAAKVKAEDWSIDLKTGAMTKKVVEKTEEKKK